MSDGRGPEVRIVGIDLGAESGRVAVGTFANDGFALEIVHRFPNRATNVGGDLRWDIVATFAEIRQGLRVAFAGGPVASVGVDTWAVDYGLIDERRQLIEPPYQYRHARSNDANRAAVHRMVDEHELFRRSGIRSMPFNTIYQLAAHRRDHPEVQARTAHFLTIPDLLHFWLSGILANERTNAGSTQLTTAGAVAWDWPTIDALGFDRRWFGPIVPAGTVLGPLLPELVAELGASMAPQVIMPASHDTASAVAAVPNQDGHWAFISSGTWSLMGRVVLAPILTEDCRRAQFSNECAQDGRIRLLKNIMGLWIVQECRRAFAADGREQSYEELSRLAGAAPRSRLPLDVDDPRFFPPGQPGDTMPERIRAWCRERALPVPADDGALVRLVIDGLADAYRRCAQALEQVTGEPVERIHIVGGGANHALLAQLTADACGKEVITGPTEATLIGNIMVQAQALGVVDMRASRDLITSTSRLRHYHPGGRAAASA